MRVDWVLLDQAAQARVQIGDLVSVEAGGAPTLRVMKLGDGRAWLRDSMTGRDFVSPLSAFHWKAEIDRG